MTRGTIVYTLSSIAFPTLTQPRVLDDLNVNISDRNGSISFEWIDLSGYPGGALQVNAFSDSFGVLLDPRIVDVLGRIRVRRSEHHDLSPATLIAELDERGACPSYYHVAGLMTQTREPAERQRLQALYERAKALER